MSNTIPLRSLGEIALAAAIKAVKNDDSAAFTATTALGLLFANRQVERCETDKDISEKANKAAFRAFLKRYAARGNMIWRDTQHMMDGIMALKGKDREKAISDYVDGGKTAGDFKRPEKARLTDGLARLRTWSFRLGADVCTNHADVIRDILAKKAAGAGGDALADTFTAFVKGEYGESFAALTDSLRTEKPRVKVDVIDSIVRKAMDMADNDLTLLIAKLEGVRLERSQTAQEVDQAFGETEAAPELIPAEPVAEPIAA